MTESKSRWTPGPWVVREGASYLDEQRQWIVIGVAHCGDGECSEANARLIAKAPQMAEALRAIVRFADTATELKVPTDAMNGWEATISAVRALLPEIED